MKRALLIAGGTLGGLGVVMAITPPQFSTSNTAGLGAGIGAIGGATSTPPASKSATAVATKSATVKAVATKKATATKAATAAATATATASASATTSATPAAIKTTAPAAPAPQGVNGTFTGPTVNVNYGNVQVQIVVKDGKIIDATALQAPSGRNDRWTNMALPILKKQTLAAQSAAIQGASGASYTSYGWFTSLQGALAKAGL